MEDISQGAERVRISFSGTAEDAHAAVEGFTYVCSSIADGQIVGSECAYDGCDHTGLSCDDVVCGCVGVHGAAYKRDGTGMLDPSVDDHMPIFECNSNCSCEASCWNRVVGRGLRWKVFVAKHAIRSKGFMLASLDFIPKGAFVLEYAGEIIRADEAERRWEYQRKLKLPNYIICIREHTTSRIFRTNIDPSVVGNAARFINHSCEPNLAFRTVRINSMIPSAALFATQDIPAGQELTFDYGDACLISGEDASLDSRIEKDDRIRCDCGAPSCRQFLPYDVTL
ncbi:histone-lysine N-methyltransferase [Chytriomyces confervae]|uniref:Histone-lysine N-methyltransferase n=1 Tax=Chytriomyces confervae TaxID=246404 RepID=A0A507FFW6_9FUNG|nr:histone-lysine N-methyltransferase [Chytriomyces confervae]